MSEKVSKKGGLERVIMSGLMKRISRRHPDIVWQDIYVSVGLISRAMCQALISGRRIEIRDFGAFFLRFRGARLARNPKSGETFLMSGKYVPQFRAGKGLRKRIAAAARVN